MEGNHTQNLMHSILDEGFNNLFKQNSTFLNNFNQSTSSPSLSESHQYYNDSLN